MGQGSPGGGKPGGYQPEPGDAGRMASFDDDGTWGNSSKSGQPSMSVPGFSPSPGVAGGGMTSAERADALAARLGQGAGGHQAAVPPTFNERISAEPPGGGGGYSASTQLDATDYGFTPPSQGSGAGGYGGYAASTGSGMGGGGGGGYSGGSQGYSGYGGGGSDGGYGGGYGGSACGSQQGSFSLGHGAGTAPPRPNTQGYNARIASFATDYSAQHETGSAAGGYAASSGSAAGGGGYGPGNLNVTQAAGGDRAPPAPPRDPVREAWTVGSVVECLSTSAGRWYVAQITAVDPQTQVMTVQFTGDDGTLKQKSMYRTDAQLSPLSSHTGGELPPGFQAKASQSRAGQSVYFDGTTGKKYASPELAWQVHFERLLARPAAVGCETVFAVPPKPAGPPSHAAMAESYPPMPPIHESRHQSMESQPPVSLDALARMPGDSQGGYFQPGTHGAPGQHAFPTPGGYGPGGGHMPPGGHGPPMNYGSPPGGYEQGQSAQAAYEQASSGQAAQATQAAADAATGKHSLPKFGDQVASNQSAYLSYVGAAADGAAPPPFAQGSQAADGFQPTRAYYGSPDESGFQPSGPRPVVRNPRAAGNPAMQAWQQDPFSEWRR